MDEKKTWSKTTLKCRDIGNGKRHLERGFCKIVRESGMNEWMNEIDVICHAFVLVIYGLPAWCLVCDLLSSVDSQLNNILRKYFRHKSIAKQYFHSPNKLPKRSPQQPAYRKIREWRKLFLHYFIMV